jgi:hypothetical protein
MSDNLVDPWWPPGNGLVTLALREGICVPLVPGVEQDQVRLLSLSVEYSTVGSTINYCTAKIAHVVQRLFIKATGDITAAWSDLLMFVSLSRHRFHQVTSLASPLRLC